MENGKELWVSFKYEQLSNLCYWCGSLTFDDTNCELWLESEGTLSIESQQFGPWICVAPFMSSQRNFVIVPDFCTRKKDGREAASSTSSRKPPVVVVRMGKPSLEIFRPEKERTKTIQRENISLNFPDEDLRQSMPTPMDCGIFKDSNISKPGFEISEKSTKNFEERIGEIDRELSRYDLSPENILAKNTCTGKENSLDALTINEINPSTNLQTHAIPHPYPTRAALANLSDALNRPQVTKGTWKR